MILLKQIEKNISVPIFLIELKLDIKKYLPDLIKDIDTGIKNNTNLNNQTHVKGYMTNWRYFVDNKNFDLILRSALKDVHNQINLKNCCLTDAWGIKMVKGSKTDMHNHTSRYYSGVLYLNDSDVDLFFPEINVKIKPSEGSFVLFSSILFHSTDKNNTDSVKYAIPFNLSEVKSWDL